MVESLTELTSILSSFKVSRIYAKVLSSNDNSKNQVYLGGGFSSLNLLPHDDIKTDSSKLAGSVRDRAKAAVKFYWLGSGQLHRAPNVQLILYPKYPEVRMSGFLSGCSGAPSELMRQRLEGRVLFLGVTPGGEILGYVSAPDSSLTIDFFSHDLREVGVFFEVPIQLVPEKDSKQQLLEKIRQVADFGWVPSQRLSSGGVAIPYRAQNGGGYTLEALLGVTPNGYAGPDFLDWEIKQYAVNNFEKNTAKQPVTIFTPEPTAGFYASSGVEHFIRKYGYPDRKGRAGRLNFGGVYKNSADPHPYTQLALNIDGYDDVNHKITDMDGQVALVDRVGEVAAAWPFSKLISHWKNKHSRAAYIPSMKKEDPREYKFGSRVGLYEGADFINFLKLLSSGGIYLDPGMKLETTINGDTKIKRRSQFRINHQLLQGLYERSELVDL